jgi:hypothetical protein
VPSPEGSPCLTVAGMVASVRRPSRILPTQVSLTFWSHEDHGCVKRSMFIASSQSWTWQYVRLVVRPLGPIGNTGVPVINAWYYVS